MLAAAALLLLLHPPWAEVQAQISKVTLVDAMVARQNGGGPKDAPQSFWTPNLVATTNGTIIIMAMAKPSFTNYMVSSQDGGQSWNKHAQPMGPPGTSQLLYSPSSDTLFMFGKSPNMIDNGTRPDPGNSQWLYQSKSTDGGMHWSDPTAINQTNPAYGPHYGGSGRTQGLELARGPHKGRLIIAKIGALASEIPPKGRAPTHAMAMYSDNQGETWTLGDELGPKVAKGHETTTLTWDEDTLTELQNGSVLLSPRIDDPANQDRKHPDTNITRAHTTRGFARSDDGGATWAEVWTLYERQPELYDKPCSDGLVYSNKTGATYFGHPNGINGSRTNYTILRSMDQGAQWSLLSPVVYPSGAGYSAMTLLPTSGAGDLLGVAFQRTIWDPNLEGGGYNIAFASVEVSPSTSTGEEAGQALAKF